jgi:hypothetical protein
MHAQLDIRPAVPVLLVLWSIGLSPFDCGTDVAHSMQSAHLPRLPQL